MAAAKVGELNSVDARDGRVFVGRRSAGEGPVLGWWDVDAHGWASAIDGVDHSVRRVRLGPGEQFAWVDGKDDLAFVGSAEDPRAQELPGVWVIATDTLLGVCGESPVVWDWVAGREVWVHDGDNDTEEWGIVVAPHPNGELVAVAGERYDTICVRRLADGELVHELEHEPTAWTDDMLFSPDGNFLAAIRHGEDIAARELLVFDVRSGERLPMLNDRAVQTLRFSPDGKRIVFGTENGIKARSLADGGRSRIDLADKVRDLAFNGSKSLLAASDSGLSEHDLD